MLILAHRGVHTAHRENTLAAFAAARGLADGVELDVRRTADGVLVVHHDAALPDDGRLIAHTAHAELPPWVPTLRQALDAAPGLVDVEVKASPLDAGYDPAIGPQAAAETQGRDVLLTSFNLSVLPEGAGWLTLPGYDQFAAVEEARRHGMAALAPPAAVTTPALIDAAHAAGLRVAVWTVNEPTELERLGSADIVITDDPGRLRAAL